MAIASSDQNKVTKKTGYGMSLQLELSVTGSGSSEAWQLRGSQGVCHSRPLLWSPNPAWEYRPIP